jgi:hypothetical protein
MAVEFGVSRSELLDCPLDTSCRDDHVIEQVAREIVR